mgnify:CR=1 FL=1|jgi:hypothetical protein
MSTLITKENRSEWLSNKSEVYIDGWTSCERGGTHMDLDGSNYSEAEYNEYTEGYSQCFDNQACIDNITR